LADVAVMDYSAFQQTASWMLTAQGQPITLTPPGGTYNVATSTFTGTGVPFQTTGVLLPLPRGLTHTPGTDIQSGDMQLLLPGTIAEPAVDTKALVNGRTYTIIEVSPCMPAGTAVYFDCIVRAPQ
jgi:hypothetical protein